MWIKKNVKTDGSKVQRATEVPRVQLLQNTMMNKKESEKYAEDSLGYGVYVCNWANCIAEIIILHDSKYGSICISLKKKYLTTISLLYLGNNE